MPLLSTTLSYDEFPKEKAMKTIQFGYLALLAVILVASAPRPAEAG
jgi:hypothetical protein